MSTDVDGGTGLGTDGRSSRRRRGRSDPARALWVVPLVASSIWGLLSGVLAMAVRLTETGEDQLSWGEVIGAACYNFALVLLATLALSWIMRYSTRRPRYRRISAAVDESWSDRSGSSSAPSSPAMRVASTLPSSTPH